MPKPPLRPMRRSAADEDDDDFFGRSIARDELSRISEGSREGGSLASSTFFSAASTSLLSSAAAGPLKLALLQQQQQQQQPHEHSGRLGAGGPSLRVGVAADSAAMAGGATSAAGGVSGIVAAGGSVVGTSSGSSVCGAETAGASPEQLKRMVKAFVEAGVRGQRIEALRRDGQPTSVVFRLSRQVDAFEIAAEAGRAAQRVDLNEVLSICTGGSDCSAELRDAMPIGLDARCTIVDLRDGRCLTLRFGSSQDASVFVQCMKLFVQEVVRERGVGAPHAASTAEAACGGGG
mmetsp:Transcript_15433/g.43017  ORF Transcript_15433/g.43017 Transcript_15433/m.43017 type:complete len:291 (+) Transcript_15433:74-946(+)